MTTIHADELQPGDVLLYDGHHHVITDVERRDGWAWPVAADGTGWAIALGHRLVCVERLTRSMRSPATQAACGRSSAGTSSLAPEVSAR